MKYQNSRVPHVCIFTLPIEWSAYHHQYCFTGWPFKYSKNSMYTFEMNKILCSIKQRKECLRMLCVFWGKEYNLIFTFVKLLTHILTKLYLFTFCHPVVIECYYYNIVTNSYQIAANQAWYKHATLYMSNHLFAQMSSSIIP